MAWSAQAEVFWKDPVTVYSAGSAPRIAVKGSTPVIVFYQETGNYKIGYTEDLGTSITTLGAAWDNYYPDIAVDGNGNAHVVWSWQNAAISRWEVYHQAQISGSFDGTSRELVSDNDHLPWSQNAPRLAVDAQKVHVIWPGDWRSSYWYRSKGISGWDMIQTMSGGTKLMGTQVASDGTNAYVFYLPRTINWTTGLRYFSTVDNLVNFTNVNPSGYGSIGWENTEGVTTCWRGNQLDAATLEDNTNSDDSVTGRVVLLLDVLNGNRTSIEVFNDGVLGSVDASARAVTMAIDESGNHYVVFSATNGGSNYQLFMQQLDAAGNKVGGLVQLTSGTVDNLSPAAVWGGRKLHLTWFTSDYKVLYRSMSEYPEAAMPVLSPAYSVISGLKPITITSTIPGAIIRYTDDGSDPSETNGIVIASGGTVSITTTNTTIKARVWATGYETSPIRSVTYTIPAQYDRAEVIGCNNSIVLDGNLSEWSGTDFVPLDMPYDGDGAPDVTNAYYAAKWSVNGKIYVAVKYEDSAHSFKDQYSGWDGCDAVEIYLHTQGMIGGYYGSWEIAQQYVAGIKASDHNSVWTNLSDTTPGSLPASAGLTVAGKVNNAMITYEFEITPFDYFGGYVGQSNVLSTLAEHDVIGLDVCVVGHNDTTYTGIKAENVWLEKSWYYTQFGLHKLGPAVALKIPGDANGDGKVDVGDLGILAANYGGTNKTWVQGDFNNDTKVDVGDLGILAANYGTGTSGANWDIDYAKAFSETVADEVADDTLCSGLGLPLIAGLCLMGLMLVKLEEV
jgi:hypothetical protein